MGIYGCYTRNVTDHMVLQIFDDGRDEDDLFNILLDIL